MRRLKQFGLAVVLMFTLATGAMAGITEAPPEAPPAPPPSAPAVSVTATGIIESPPSAQATDGASDPVVDLAFFVLQSVLSLF